jgi:hypothetical protein
MLALRVSPPHRNRRKCNLAEIEAWQAPAPPAATIQPQERKGEAMNPNHEKIRETAASVCRFCLTYKTAAPLSAGSATANITRRHLQTLAATLYDEMDPGTMEKLRTSVSRGASLFPRVPWLSFVPAGKKVSNSLSVTVCFSSDGNGFVGGVMVPAAGLQQRYETRQRRDSRILVSVDGPTGKPRYNSSFINPKEFLLESFDPADLIAHLQASVLLLKET